MEIETIKISTEEYEQLEKKYGGVNSVLKCSTKYKPKFKEGDILESCNGRIVIDKIIMTSRQGDGVLVPMYLTKDKDHHVYYCEINDEYFTKVN
jgi:hypothetical protein